MSGCPASASLVGGALAALADQRELIDWFDACTRLSEAHQLPWRPSSNDARSSRSRDELPIDSV